MNPIHQPPVMVVARGPFATPGPEDVREVPVGATLAELSPETHGKPLIVTLDGGASYILRKDWGYRVESGDIVTFLIDPPQDREALRGILMVVIAVVSTIISQGAAGPYWAAAFSVAAGLAVNFLLPIKPPEMLDPQAASPTYSASLSGNLARLDQVIPKILGRMKITPPFAAQPYLEYENNNSFYRACFAIGIGNHDVENVLIDDTSITHFQDVLTSRYLPPGTLPSDVLSNVATAPEVAGQDLLFGKYVGGFAACAPRKKATHIGIDIQCPRGLGVAADNGSMGLGGVSWRVEVRSVNEFGIAVTPWTVVAFEVREAATTTPQRWSNKYALAAPIRPEVRVVRVNEKNESGRALNDIVWTGLRAYLDEDAPLHPDVAHYEVVLRASDQLSSLSQRNISMIVKALTRTWHPDTGWSEEVHTRNPAWAIAELWSSGVWGEGLPDDRIDLQTLYDLSLVWEARQDRCDLVIDSATDAWELAQTIARTGRARCFRRYGVMTLARDQLETLPITAFTPRNCIPDSMILNEALPVEDTPDGIIIEYYDNRQWDWKPIECPCPGVEAMQNPLYKRVLGISGPIHAEREGLYEAASLALRTRKVSCTTEMAGILPAFLSPIRWMPETVNYGQSGDVSDWDEGTLTMELTEPVTWGDEPNYITLVRDDGSLTTPVQVLPGATPYTVVLPEVPDFDLVLDDAARERPKYLLGPLETSDELVKIAAISDGGKQDEAQLFNIDAVIDDPRVHAADNHLLPGPGDIQDPVVPGDEVDPGNDDVFGFVAHLNGVIQLPGYILRVHEQTFEFRTDGTLWLKQVTPAIHGSVAVYTRQDNQWILQGMIEPLQAARFEVRWTPNTTFATVGATPESSVSLSTNDGVWYPITETRSFSVFLPDMDPMPNVPMFYIGRWIFEIRDIATGIVQASGNYYADADNTTPGT